MGRLSPTEFCTVRRGGGFCTVRPEFWTDAKDLNTSQICVRIFDSAQEVGLCWPQKQVVCSCSRDVLQELHEFDILLLSRRPVESLSSSIFALVVVRRLFIHLPKL